jgi:hypothetical protein
MVPLFVDCPSSNAGSLCTVDKATSEKLETLTSRGSISFLEAASHAFLTFKAIEEGAESVDLHRANTFRLLDEALRAYKDALELSDDLHRADAFLRSRPFDRLQATLGMTPGTLNHTRWQIFAQTARTSKTPAADLIRVCVSGTETLKYTMSTSKPDMPPSMLRRAASTWFGVLSHGELVSDAFDSTTR